MEEAQKAILEFDMTSKPNLLVTPTKSQMEASNTLTFKGGDTQTIQNYYHNSVDE